MSNPAESGNNDPNAGFDVTYVPSPTTQGDYLAVIRLADGECFTDITLQANGAENDKIKVGLEGFSFTVPEPALNITKDVASVTDGPDANNAAGANGAGDIVNYTITVQTPAT